MAIALPLCMSQLGSAQVCMDFMPGSDGAKVPHVSMGLHIQLPIVPLVEAVARFAELHEEVGQFSSTSDSPAPAAPAPARAAPTSKEADGSAANSEAEAKDSLGQKIDKLFRLSEESGSTPPRQGAEEAPGTAQPVPAWKLRVRRVPKPHMLFGDGAKRGRLEGETFGDKDPYDVAPFLEPPGMMEAAATAQGGGAPAAASSGSAASPPAEAGEPVGADQACEPKLQAAPTPVPNNDVVEEQSRSSTSRRTRPATKAAIHQEVSQEASAAEEEPVVLVQDEIERALEALQGLWMGPDGASYEVFPSSPSSLGAGLTVKARMPAGTVVSRKEAITASACSGGSEIVWSKGPGQRFMLACRPPPADSQPSPLLSAPWKGARGVCRWTRADPSASAMAGAIQATAREKEMNGDGDEMT